MSTEQAARLSDRLRSEGEKTLAFFSGLTPEQHELPVYTEGAQWTVRQILAHFVSAEAAFLSLVGDITSGGRGAPEGFNIDHFNDREVAQKQEMQSTELLEQFSTLRRRTIEVVDELSDGDLAKMGVHPFLGLVPLIDMIKLIYRHNQIHMRDIRRVAQPGA
jgi:uncharacterized damage-inducible protein DinB